MKKKGGKLIGLLVVTACAVAVALALSAAGWSNSKSKDDADLPDVVPPTPVFTMKVHLESIEVTDSYSGMIRPFERFSLGFEISGRLMILGTNSADKPLDDGDRVTAGQTLARLDDRVLVARLKEAKARREQAQADMNRAKELKKRDIRAITNDEYQDRVTELTLADAQFEMAEKNLEDARLLAPVDGLISKRHVNVGESVNPHQTIFTIIQVKDVLLIIGVPEAYVGEIGAGQPVHVELLARNRFGRRRGQITGRVYRVAEAADDTTGLFEVEILLPNPKGDLKPGLIALAHVVVDQVQGFRIPLTSAVFRDDEVFMFYVGEDGKAHRLDLESHIEQGTDLVLSELPPSARTIVVSGQHRLVEGRRVRVTRASDTSPTKPDAKIPVRAPEVRGEG